MTFINGDTWLYIGIGCGLASIVVSLFYYRWVARQEPGIKKAQEIAGWIKEGASTYLKKLYRALIVVALVLGVVLAFVFSGNEAKPLHGLYTALAFGFGALCSALAGWLGMSIAVKANVRTATACQRSLGQGFNVAFKAGYGHGAGDGRCRGLRHQPSYLLFHDPEIVLGFSFGASSLALFAKAGGGIYTKTAGYRRGPHGEGGTRHS